jgi:hypothetical protein
MALPGTYTSASIGLEVITAHEPPHHVNAGSYTELIPELSGFEVLWPVTVKCNIFCDMTPFSLAKV